VCERGAFRNILFLNGNFGRYFGSPFTVGHQQKYRKTGGFTIPSIKSKGSNVRGPSSRKYITVGVSANIYVLH